MKGLSVYSGGLWLAALKSAIEICKILENSSSSSSNQNELKEWRQKIEKILEKGSKYYESQLWDEDIGCYIYDNTKSPNSVAILADALEGHFNLLGSFFFHKFVIFFTNLLFFQQI